METALDNYNRLEEHCRRYAPYAVPPALVKELFILWFMVRYDGTKGILQDKVYLRERAEHVWKLNENLKE